MAALTLQKFNSNVIRDAMSPEKSQIFICRLIKNDAAI